MAWDEAKREAARQRMKHATEVRMAKLAQRQQQGPEPERGPSTAIDDVSGVVIPIPDLTLTVRRSHVGSFSGLWELCRVNADGTRTVVTDANTKAMVINLARNEILKCGQS